MLDLAKIQEIVIRLALENGKMLIEKWDNVSVARLKESEEICTNLDLEIEHAILKTLQQHFPKHNYNCEESGEKQNGSEYTWYIDPIDGTRNYIRHLPTFNISIALAEKNDVIFAVVYNPLTHELFYAARDQGARLLLTSYDHLFKHEELRQLQVSNQNNFKKGFLHIELPTKKAEDFKKAQKQLCTFLDNVERVRSIGSGAQALCYTAMGAFDAYIDLSSTTRPFDIAAGTLIAKEAGARLSDFEGNPFDLKSKNLVASNGLIHQEILALLI